MALFAAGMILSLVFSLRANDAALERVLAAEAHQARASVTRHWALYRELVDALARDPEVIDALRTGSVEDRQRWAASRQRLVPGVLAIALVGADGEVHDAARALHVYPDCRRDLRRTFSRETIVHRDRAGFEHVDLVAEVKAPDGQVIGGVFVSVRLVQFRHILDDATQPGHAVELFDGQGRPMVKSGDAVGPALREVSVSLPSTGWTLSVKSPLDRLTTASLMHILAGMLTLAGVVLLLVVVVLRMRRPVSEEINAALGALASLTRDEAAPPLEARYAEFAPVVAAINRIAQQLREQREQLAMLSMTDTLTGLPNRRAFETQFAHMLGLADRGHRIALVLLDVDHFKAINDELGHAAGDQALVALATTLKALTRSADMAARLAGDEFTVLLTGLDDRGIETWYERLASRFASELAAADLRVSNTISAGQTWLQPVAGDSIGKALGRADDALYEAKEHGRAKLVLGDARKRNGAG